MAGPRWRCIQHIDEAMVDMTKDNHPALVRRDVGSCNECGTSKGLIFRIDIARCVDCGFSSGHKADCTMWARS